MQNLIISFSTILFFSCANVQHSFDSEEEVFNRNKESYHLLRQSLLDSLDIAIKNVNDFANLYSYAEEQNLDSILIDYRTQTGFKLVIFTFDSAMASIDSVGDATRIVGIKNRIGTTIGISLAHKTIHIWNDSLINNTLLDQYSTKSIIEQYFTPSFSKGYYYDGTLQGVNAIIHRILNKMNSRKPLKLNGS